MSFGVESMHQYISTKVSYNEVRDFQEVIKHNLKKSNYIPSLYQVIGNSRSSNNNCPLAML